MAQDAQTLLKKMDNVMFSPKDKQGNVEIYLINNQGKEKAPIFTGWSQIWAIWLFRLTTAERRRPKGGLKHHGRATVEPVLRP